MTQITLTRDSVAQMVRRLRSFLEAGGTPLKQRNAYQAVATMLGYQDWNTLCAALKDAPRQQPTPAKLAAPPPGDPDDNEPFMSNAQMEALMARRGTELVVRRIISGKRFGGMLVRLIYRGNPDELPNGDELLFRHREVLRHDIYLRDADYIPKEAPFTYKHIIAAAAKRTVQIARYLEHIVPEGVVPIGYSEAPTARPVAIWDGDQRRAG